MGTPVNAEWLIAATADDHHADASQGARHAQFLHALVASLQAMPARHAQTFLLGTVLGHGTDEVCAALGMSPGPLWVTVHRTPTRLQRELQAHAE